MESNKNVIYSETISLAAAKHAYSQLKINFSAVISELLLS
jgi:hypothetical protein